MKLRLSDIGKCIGVFFGLLATTSQAQPPEVLTLQGGLPRLNYRTDQGSLIWALPANNTLWKLDGPFNAGVLICTAAAKSNSIVMNEGGVSIRGTGFPSAKLHVGAIASATQPGEVRVDPGNPSASATIHAVNAALPATMILETQSPSFGVALTMKTTLSQFSHTVGTNFAIRDNNNAVNPLIIVPSNKNINTLVIKNGNIGMGITNPTSPLALASGAKCSAGGVWTNASSRELKKDIEALPLKHAQQALSELQPVTYRYKAEPEEPQVGFIAEDVPQLVATNSRKELSPMDVVAVLTKVVQDQQSRLDAQAEQLKQQQALLEELAEKVRLIEAR